MQHNRYFADISSNQRSFDAQAYASAGHLLIALKASEGQSFVDPNHRGWCLHAGMHHLGVVHYHFGRPDLNSDAEQEAMHFVRTVRGLLGGRDCLVLDFERHTPAGFRTDPAWSRTFAVTVKHLTGHGIVLYASRSWLQESDLWLPEGARFVWDADWSEAPTFMPPGYEALFRQYTDGLLGPEPHAFAGIGRCDGNRMSQRVFDHLVRDMPCQC